MLRSGQLLFMVFNYISVTIFITLLPSGIVQVKKVISTPSKIFETFQIYFQAGAELCQAQDKLRLAKSDLPS